MIKYNPDKPLISIHIPKCGGTTLLQILEDWFNDGRHFPDLYNHPRILKRVWHNRIDLIYQQLMGYGLIRHNYFHQYGYKPRIIKAERFFSIKKFKHVPICIHGHFDNYPKEDHVKKIYPTASQFISFLRDPLQMEISMYFHRKKLAGNGEVYFKGAKTRIQMNPDINQYLMNKKSYMLWTLPWDVNENNYRDIIENNFVFLGVLEEFDRSVRMMSEIFNKKYIPYPVKNQTPRDEELSEEVKSTFRENNRLEFMIYNYVKNKILSGK